ncbi:hypothetical protein C7M61_002744 [Candidozyma pseudohaemuli]|uniref:Uncharacterized protein n=1 Tax=Candidozyma pseudohaemuli TaxID=418784 RepID=A0A2P7YQG9_9ASCO|nr:hypothetical protein C7M61_002744 [[Candida] pseudohaemulonii]PSK38189.1 hypothetical protein C7M61_002744 [[Candida] pseudohaemulonii]
MCVEGCCANIFNFDIPINVRHCVFSPQGGVLSIHEFKALADIPWLPGEFEYMMDCLSLAHRGGSYYQAQILWNQKIRDFAESHAKWRAFYRKRKLRLATAASNNGTQKADTETPRDPTKQTKEQIQNEDTVPFDDTAETTPAELPEPEKRSLV